MATINPSLAQGSVRDTIYYLPCYLESSGTDFFPVSSNPPFFSYYAEIEGLISIGCLAWLRYILSRKYTYSIFISKFLTVTG